MLPGTSTGCPVFRNSGGRPEAPGPKGRGPLAMDAYLERQPIYNVDFKLGNIVAEIIHLNQLPALHLPGERLLKGAPG